MARLTFHGAAQTVTGSKFLLEADGAAVLVDCGLFQGEKKLRELNWEPTPFNPRQLDAVVLTHAHLDHVGYLPRLVKEGYDGPIYSTPATRELAEIILLDSAKIQESDADYANRKGYSKHKPALPLYEDRDVERTMRLFAEGPRKQWFCAAGEIWMRFHDAGHLLGSSMIEVEVRSRTPPLRLLFSGDVGRYNGPLYFDPVPPPACDYLICESTYGDREHPEESILDALDEVVKLRDRAWRRDVDRGLRRRPAQQLVYLLQVLHRTGRIPRLPIYVDSPMAVDATTIYRQHFHEHDLSEADLDPAHPVLDGMNVHLCRTADESKAINDVPGPAVVIATSGMMTGGRIIHHLKQRLPSSRHTVILGGFQAAGTRGRRLQEGAKVLRMHGVDVPVRAAVESIPGLSGHADRSDLLRWLEPLPAPKGVFLVHGEPESASAFAETLRAWRGWSVTLPAIGDSFELR